ncbi:glycosyltransferase family 25 protein [Edwardsiella hoshinae]|uniref:glycosyltransferase family 25 protein n=1 Tax=Edwardsiella hoshinae TaxID=93378 RepID=UPI0009F3D63D|nr:glycosyltransferase family 25 protein [Edwardsiella hoshinae]
MSKENRVAIFVLSLDGSTRRQRILEQLQRIGLDFDFIDAINGASLPMQTIDSINVATAVRYRRAISAGEIGCALSHQKIYQIICDNQINYALILEDDVSITSGLIDIVKYFKFEAKSVADRNLYLLGGQDGLASQDMIVTSLRKKIKISERVSFAKLNSSSKYIYRTCCYVISGYLAKTLLESNRESFFIADDWHYLYRKGVFDKLYLTKIVSHPMVLNDSTLEQGRQVKASYWKISKLRRLLRGCKCFIRKLIRLY